ncbi:hypothetical protein Aduo_009323 [Ancylostoma duodenale]
MQWLPVAPMPAAVSRATVVSHGNEIYVIGGTCRGQDSSLVQIYHADTGTWDFGASLGATRRDAAAVVVSFSSAEHSLIGK